MKRWGGILILSRRKTHTKFLLWVKAERFGIKDWCTESLVKKDGQGGHGRMQREV